MEAIPFLLVAFLTLCLMPSGFALQCGTCGKGIPGMPKCDSGNVPKRTCPQHWDRCFTATVVYTNGSEKMEVIDRNCTSTYGCDPKSQYYICNYFKNNETTMASCKVDCCPTDMCNLDGPSTTLEPATTVPAISVGLAASFGAILLALVLTMLV
ncbi:hypothetical protein OS493_032133 [Desmophyllum pertusum]|uniref:UPAR/Ly6 domain-containing protein n=1 Tax=Desmophyllum pertusum TaxID=174260 RepID=A0A9W9YJR1_9CNID|nr:hypothetical protein OS493_032133 [Desmophyllum pertusum]